MRSGYPRLEAVFADQKYHIPPRANRTEQREIDPHLYRERNLCERFWARAKQFRRVATRYEKKAANFLAFAWVASLMIMLK